jgi:hypothetical protein
MQYKASMRIPRNIRSGKHVSEGIALRREEGLQDHIKIARLTIERKESNGLKKGRKYSTIQHWRFETLY